MFPGEILDAEDAEDAALFKAVLYKRLSPFEVSVDPALESEATMDTDISFLDRKSRLKPKEGNGSEDDYIVPKVGYTKRWVTPFLRALGF